MVHSRQSRCAKTMAQAHKRERPRNRSGRSWLFVEQLEDRVTPSVLIPVTNHRDLVFDPYRNLLDITTSAGTVQRYSLAYQALLDSLYVGGTSLNGADITPDGSALYVTEQQPAGSQAVLHKVNLANGTVTQLAYPLGPGEGGSWDIALGSNGKGLVDGTSAGAGWVPLRQLDLSTDSVSVRTDDPGSGGGGTIGANTLFHRSADRTLTLVTESGVPSGPMFTYNAVSDTFGSSLSTGLDLSNALSAVSRDGTWIALEYNGSVVITDRYFNYVKSLPNQDGGVVFDPVQDVLYTVSSATNQITAFDTNSWAAKFQMPIGETVTPGSAFGNGVMTVSNDGSLLFLATPSGVRMFNLPTNGGPAVSLVLGSNSSTTTAGAAVSFMVAAVDANGQLATGYRGTVLFASSDAQATVPASYTFTAADGGMHTFTATLRTAGGQQIYAKDVNTPSIYGIENLTVSPAALASFGLAVGSSPQPAGYPFNVTVTARDAYNNTITNYAGTVHFTSTDSAAILPADYTFAAADNGVHAFSVNLQTAGNQSVNVADTANTAATGSASVLVANFIPGLYFTMSASVTSATAGTPFSVTVTAYDQYNNVATHYVGTIHFTTSDRGAGVVLPADYTFTAADNGVHVFSGVTLVTAGSEAVGFADTSFTIRGVGASVSVTITPAAASTLNVSGFPSLITAGSAGTFTVSARDPYGNLATGYSGTVHFSTSAAKAALPADTLLANGTGTFSATLSTAGTQSLTASDTVNAALTSTQAGITVKPAAASTFQVTGFPSPTTAGVAGTLAIQALDPYGNLATGYSGTVHFSSSDSQASLPANATLTNGAGTFSATLKTAGVQSLSATDNVTATVTGTQSTITVIPATAAQLHASAPAAATAGTGFSITITAVDSFNNTATGYRGTLHFTSTDGNAALPTDYAFTAADGGVHAFNITLKTAGSQSITLTDSVNGLGGSAVGIVVNAAALNRIILAGYPSSRTAGVAGNFTVTAQDSYGNTVVGYTGTVAFSSSDSQASLPAAYTFSAADGGVHTFTATLKSAGTQTLTATDSANGFIATQGGIAVSAAALGQFVVSGFPSTTTAGVAGAFTVTAKDPYGNIATGYTGAVTFTSSDTQAALPGNYTFTSSDNGVHTFTATLKTAGSQALTVKDTTTGIAGNQSGIVVTAASPTHLVVSAPSTTRAGTAFSVTVTAADAYGNVATSYVGTVHFSSTDAKAVLPGNYAFTSGDNGAHSFTVTLKTAGSQSLTVTDTVTPSIVGTQSGIGVTAAAASQFIVSAPATAKAQVAFSVTITAVDAYGNIATGYVGTIHFTSSDHNAVLPSNYTFSQNDAGVHTFSVTLKSGGNQTLTITDTLNSSLKGSATVKVG